MEVPLITLQYYIRFILKEHVFCDFFINTLVRIYKKPTETGTVIHVTFTIIHMNKKYQPSHIT
jgi:hypothetical protein